MPRAAKWVIDAMEGLMGSKLPLMTVVSSRYINNNIKLIRFEGRLTGMDFQLGYAVAVRVSDTEFRNYTASFVDIDKGILEIIFHIHQTAVGCMSMDRLMAGDKVRITFPRGVRQYDGKVKRQVLFGDETSLGLACSFQNILKRNNHQYRFLFELEYENAQVPSLLGLENYVVLAKKSSSKRQDWLDRFSLISLKDWSSSNFVLVGNASSVQLFKKILKEQDIKGKVFAKAYWAEGRKGL